MVRPHIEKTNRHSFHVEKQNLKRTPNSYFFIGYKLWHLEHAQP